MTTGYRNYPLSNPEGMPIPIDLLEPVGMLEDIYLDDTALLSSVVIPNTAKIFLEIWCTTDCIIGFTVDPVDGLGSPGMHHLRADDPKLIMPIGGYISGICGKHDSGILRVNLLSLWESTKKDYQVEQAE